MTSENITERLRDAISTGQSDDVVALLREAADEITRLTEEVERLEKQNRGLCEREEMHIQEALDIQAKADALAEALGR